MKALMKTVKGAALVEYGILVGLIAVVAIAAVTQLGGTISDTFSDVASTLSTKLDDAQN